MGITILFALIGFIALFQSIVDWRHWNYIKHAPLPQEFAEWGEDHRKKMIAYARDRLVLDNISHWVGFFSLLLFFYAGIYRWLVIDLIDKLPGNVLVHGLCFFGCLGLLSFLLQLPFSYYSQFVVEEKYGFNRTAFPTFIADRIKGILLALILGGPLLALILYFFQNFLSGWLFAWLAYAAFQLILFWAAPVWIMPLFNRFTILNDGDLKEKILALGRKLDFPLQDVFTMDGSKRSSKANAYFTGFGKNRRIVLFDTLLEKHSTNELIAVLAHEIGHYRLGHIPQMLAWSLLSSFVLFYLSQNFVGEFGMTYFSFGGFYAVHLGLYFFLLALGPLGFLGGLVSSYLSRKNEYAADAYAKKAVGSGNDLAQALKKLSVDSLSVLDPHPWKVLEYSHPPVLFRMRALQKEKI